MQTVEMSELTRPFEWESKPPTKWDAVPAVLYRVGQHVDAYDVKRRFTEAEEEAITDRFIPRLGSTRRRYLAAVAVEEPQDLALPPNERPALLRAFELSALLSGGLLIEREADLGSRRDADALLVLAAGFAGSRSGTHEVYESIGTYTVGFMRGSGGRRNATRYDFQLMYNTNLKQSVEALRRLDGHLSEWVDPFVTSMKLGLKRRLDAAAWTTLARRSDLFDALTTDAAADYVRHCRLERIGADNIVRWLRLYGFINPAGHRTWSKADLALLERRVR